MDNSAILPKIEFGCEAVWEKLNDRHILNKKILCGDFELEFLLLEKNANIFLSQNQALTILNGKLKINNKGLLEPWINQSLVKENKVEAVEESLIIVTTNKLRMENKNILEFSELILPDKPEGFPLRWSEFPLLPGLFRTQPDIVIGSWHIRLRRAMPNMNCGIGKHARRSWLRETNFLLSGSASIVFYKEQDVRTEIKRSVMEFGKCHKVFFEEKNGVVTYPWHAWQAGPVGSLSVMLEDWSLQM